MLNARDEKNRRGSEIPLRTDLAADIRSWLADRLAWAQQAARDTDEPILAALPSDDALFDVPDGLIRIFDRDLVFAGLARIEKRGGKEVVVKTDDRGRTIDIHALRHTFGTHLSKAGVPLRTAQAAMRHSDPSLTANVYTDPKLLDVAGAVASLPDLPLGGVAGSSVAVATRLHLRLHTRLHKRASTQVIPCHRPAVGPDPTALAPVARTRGICGVCQGKAAGVIV